MLNCCSASSETSSMKKHLDNNYMKNSHFPIEQSTASIKCSLCKVFVEQSKRKNEMENCICFVCADVGRPTRMKFKTFSLSPAVEVEKLKVSFVTFSGLCIHLKCVNEI